MASVSIVIPAYNAERFVAAAITSVLNQTFADLEVIVVDDGSTDSTAARARACADHRVRIVESENRGPAAARNKGIDETDSPWIAVLDADDMWDPRRLEALIGVGVVEHADVVFDDIVPFGTSDSEPSLFEGIGLELSGPTFIELSDYIRGNLAGRPTPSPGLIKPVTRRAFLADTGVRYVEDVRGPEDRLYVSQCLLHGARAMLVPSRTYFYRLLPDSLSRRDPVAFLENRLRLIDHLSRDPLMPIDLQPVLASWRGDSVALLAARRVGAAVDARRWRDAAQIVRRKPISVWILLREAMNRARVRAAPRRRLAALCKW